MRWTMDCERECKNCGEWLEVKEDAETVTCPVCNTVYSVDRDVDGVSIYVKSSLKMNNSN